MAFKLIKRFAVSVCYLLSLVIGCNQRSIEIHRHDETLRYLGHLSACTKSVLNQNQKLPNGGFRGLLNQLKNDGELNTYPMLESGLDSWGNEILLDTTDGKTVRFRSIGPNMIDDHGNGDDLEISFVRRDSWKL